MTDKTNKQECITDNMSEEDKAEYEEMLNSIAQSFTEEELATIKELLDKQRSKFKSHDASKIV
ncbi:MAG: hypothetical protein WC877_00585 [Dehalococcoidales bacterium]